MKLFWLLLSGLLFAPACAAQTAGLPRELPEKLSVAYRLSGGMSRSYRSVKIENGRLAFEELKGGRPRPEKWSAAVSQAELAALYRVFVENRFDTIENDARQGIVYDAGSESISLAIGGVRSFGVTYGKNSPLSGRHLERYQAVRRAIEELTARAAAAKTENDVDEAQAEAARQKLAGAWRAAGENGGRAWFLEWRFRADGTFRQTGYPPLAQEGKYRVIEAEGDRLRLALSEQRGTFGAGDRTLEIVVGKDGAELTIGGTRGFARVD